jgi:hypothetical protein
MRGIEESPQFFSSIPSQQERRTMADKIVVSPEILDLQLYAGDGLTFRMICQTKAGDPVDITGTVNAQIRLARLTPDPPITAFSVNLVDAWQGILTFSLTGDQTQDLIDSPASKNGLFAGVWDAQWHPSNAEPYTLCQGKVECVADVTRP